MPTYDKYCNYCSFICNYFLSFLHTGSSDYTPIASEEVTFTNGQTTSDIQCISVAILDDNNVLEVAVETFEVLLTANDTVVSFPAGQENTTVNINEDTLDGKYYFMQPAVHYYSFAINISCCSLYMYHA